MMPAVVIVVVVVIVENNVEKGLFIKIISINVYNNNKSRSNNNVS